MIRGVIEFYLRAADDRELRAVLGEALRERELDAAITARHDGDFAAQQSWLEGRGHVADCKSAIPRPLLVRLFGALSLLVDIEHRDRLAPGEALSKSVPVRDAVRLAVLPAEQHGVTVHDA